MSNLLDIIGTDPLPVGETKDYGLLPEGWYDAVISAAEIRDTKAGTGKLVAVTFDVTGPTHQGRKVWANLNIKNPNPKAEEIGRQQLGEIARSIGVGLPKDTAQLIGGRLQIKVVATKSEQYGDKNETKGYKAMSGGMPATVAAAPAASTKAAPPWVKS
jgi:hypothetical protein